MRHALERRVWIWLAIAAVLLNALAPALSHALTAEKKGAGWTQICTSKGTAWVRIDSAQEAPSSPDRMPADSSVDHASDCGYCLTHGGSFGLAAVIPMVDAPASRGSTPPTPTSCAALRQTAWLRPCLRAPPQNA